MFRVQYIGHSGFAAELERHVFLFDYYTGKLPVFPKEKPLYVFCSHHHSDHFNPEIFKLAQNGETRYVLADDIWVKGKKYEAWGLTDEVRSRILQVQARKEYRLDDLIIRTLKSTDEGVAFLIEAEGKRIYHAGDLNWWAWIGEEERENDRMTAAFQEEIKSPGRIHVDAAFLPLDDRQEEWFWRGMDWYLRNWEIDYAFPMHFWEDGTVIERFEKLACRKDYGSVICDTVNQKEWDLDAGENKGGNHNEI